VRAGHVASYNTGGGHDKDYLSLRRAIMTLFHASMESSGMLYRNRGQCECSASRVVSNRKGFKVRACLGAIGLVVRVASGGRAGGLQDNFG